MCGRSSAAMGVCVCVCVRVCSGRGHGCVPGVGAAREWAWVGTRSRAVKGRLMSCKQGLPSPPPSPLLPPPPPPPLLPSFTLSFPITFVPYPFLLPHLILPHYHYTSSPTTIHLTPSLLSLNLFSIFHQTHQPFFTFQSPYHLCLLLTSISIAILQNRCCSSSHPSSSFTPILFCLHHLHILLYFLFCVFFYPLSFTFLQHPFLFLLHSIPLLNNPFPSQPIICFLLLLLHLTFLLLQRTPQSQRCLFPSLPLPPIGIIFTLSVCNLPPSSQPPSLIHTLASLIYPSSVFHSRPPHT